MNKPVVGLIATLVAIGALVAGCGSSSDSTESTEGGEAAAITKSEFIKQADSICAEGSKSIEAEFEEFGKEHHLSENAPKAAREEAVEEVLIPAINRQISEVRALGTPEGDEGEVEEVIVAQEEVMEEAEEDPATFLQGETAKQKEANKLAQNYGLKVCGSEEEEGKEGKEG